MRLELPRFVYAPVAEGDRVGWASVTLDGETSSGCRCWRPPKRPPFTIRICKKTYGRGLRSGLTENGRRHRLWREPPAEYIDVCRLCAEERTDVMRIQKLLSEAGVLSRRKAEEYVRDGRVTVNGRPAVTGQDVNPKRDAVAVDGKRVDTAERRRLLYVMLYKPRGYVTTLSDNLGRRCVAELIAGLPGRSTRRAPGPGQRGAFDLYQRRGFCQSDDAPEKSCGQNVPGHRPSDHDG